MPNTLPVAFARVDTPTPKPRAKKLVPITSVMVLNPLKLGQLRAAKALGARFAVEFDGYTLSITAEK